MLTMETFHIELMASPRPFRYNDGKAMLRSSISGVDSAWNYEPRSKYKTGEHDG